MKATKKKKERRLGIMGGTFDPIHYGHLATAEAARERYGLERILFIPTGCPPHKEPGSVSNFWDRYMMVMLAVLSNPYFEVSRLEYDRGGVSYTIDTLIQLQEMYGKDTDFYFICGIDTMLSIFTWKRPHDLFALCRFIVAMRPGYDSKQLYDMLGDVYRERVCVMEIPMLDISSTEIRERVKKGLSIKYLLPEAVEAYIYKNNVYHY